MYKQLLKFRLIIILIIVFISIIINVSGQQISERNVESGDIVVYSFPYEIFNKFIENPATNIFSDNENKIIISSLSKSSNKQILRKTINQTPTQIEEMEGGIYVGKTPVYLTLIDFVTNREMLKAFLIKNNIVINSINNINLLDVPNMPAIIWIQDNQQNYYITVDEKYEDKNVKKKEDEYIYRVYSDKEFYSKFSDKEGILIVNGKNVTTNNFVKINYSGTYISLRGVIESLGQKIEWDDANCVARLMCNGKTYILDCQNKLSLVEEGTSNNILILPPGGIYYYCSIINGQTIINENAMRMLLRLMDATINVDYNNLIVNINS